MKEKNWLDCPTQPNIEHPQLHSITKLIKYFKLAKQNMAFKYIFANKD